MGVEGEDFIDNPNRTEYVDEDEIDLDEHLDIIVDYGDEEQDQDSVFIYTSDDDAFNDTVGENDEDDDDDDPNCDLFYPDDADAFFSGDSDNCLSDFDDGDEEDSDGELRGYMVNGVFVAPYINPRILANTVESETIEESETKGGNDNDSRDNSNGDGDNNEVTSSNTPQTATC